jgi:hypothetical protein
MITRHKVIRAHVLSLVYIFVLRALCAMYGEPVCSQQRVIVCHFMGIKGPSKKLKLNCIITNT